MHFGNGLPSPKRLPPKPKPAFRRALEVLNLVVRGEHVEPERHPSTLRRLG